jgi:hypothetical protein
LTLPRRRRAHTEPTSGKLRGEVEVAVRHRALVVDHNDAGMQQRGTGVQV